MNDEQQLAKDEQIAQLAMELQIAKQQSIDTNELLQQALSEIAKYKIYYNTLLNSYQALAKSQEPDETEEGADKSVLD